MESLRFESEHADGWHEHALAQIIIVLDGAWQETSSTGLRTLRFGDLLFHPAHAAHAHRVESGTSILLVELSAALMGEYCAAYGNRPRSIQFTFDALDGLPGRLAAELGGRDDEALTVLVAEGLLRLMLASGARAVNRAVAGSAWLPRVLAFIDANLGEPISVRDLARVAFISVSTVTRSFRSELGSSPSEFIRMRRIREAVRLLRHTHLPIQEVANATGFYDQAHFCRTFKAIKRMTPIEYRKACAEAAVVDTIEAGSDEGPDSFALSSSRSAVEPYQSVSLVAGGRAAVSGSAS